MTGTTEAKGPFKQLDPVKLRQEAEAKGNKRSTMNNEQSPMEKKSLLTWGSQQRNRGEDQTTARAATRPRRRPAGEATREVRGQARTEGQRRARGEVERRAPGRRQAEEAGQPPPQAGEAPEAAAPARRQARGPVHQDVGRGPEGQSSRRLPRRVESGKPFPSFPSDDRYCVSMCARGGLDRSIVD